MRKYIHKIFFGFAAAIAALAVVSCEDTIDVEGVSFDQTSAAINVGETLKLTATVTPSSADDLSVTWASSDESVATVDQNGLVTGVSNGTSTITATTTDGGFVAKCEVTVKTPVTGVSVEPTSIVLLDDATDTIEVTITPDDASNVNYSIESADPTIATVSSDGVVKGVSAGKTTITVTTEDGSYTATVDVTVYFSANLNVYSINDSTVINDDLGVMLNDTVRIKVVDITDLDYVTTTDQLVSVTVADESIVSMEISEDENGQAVINLIGKKLGSTTLTISYIGERGTMEKTLNIYVTETGAIIPDIPVNPAGI